MSDSLHELFHVDAMGAMVERYAEGSDNSAWIDVYDEGEKIQANVDGTFKFSEIRYSRDAAAIQLMDSPSTSSKKPIEKKKVGQCFLIQEHVDLPARFLEGWLAPGQTVSNGAAVMRLNLKNLTMKVQTQKNVWAAKSMLTQTGVVDLSALPNSQIASGSLTYPVKEIDAAASWVTPTTKIRSSEINTMLKTYRQAAGFSAARVQASKAIEGYLTGNTEISNLLAGTTEAGRIVARSFETARQSNDAVVNFGGLDWRFVEDYYALDSAKDTPVDVNSDAAIFALLPPSSMSQEAFAIAEGVSYSPKGTIAGPVGSVLFNTHRGWFAWVELMTGQAGLRLHVGWLGCLVQKIPSAVGVFDSDP